MEQSGHALMTHIVAHMLDVPSEYTHIKHLSEPSWMRYLAAFLFFQE